MLAGKSDPGNHGECEHGSGHRPRVARTAAIFGTANLLFRTPTGLAVGLAWKESRYAERRRFAPSETELLWVPRSPRPRGPRRLGWV